MNRTQARDRPLRASGVFEALLKNETRETWQTLSSSLFFLVVLSFKHKVNHADLCILLFDHISQKHTCKLLL